LIHKNNVLTNPAGA